MNSNPGIPFRPLWLSPVRASLFGALLLGLGAFANMACEDNGIGRPCDLMANAGESQAVYNAQALECPSRICLKPLLDDDSTDRDTGAYCSATCSKDSDCEGQKRDGSNVNDKRCANGYACGVAFEVGPLCCKKVCLCKDFLGGKAVALPKTCDPSEHDGKTGCAEQP